MLVISAMDILSEEMSEGPRELLPAHHLVITAQLEEDKQRTITESRECMDNGGGLKGNARKREILASNGGNLAN